METLFERALIRKLGELREQKVQVLSKSIAPDYGEYLKRMGYLQAVDDIAGLIEEIQTEMRKQ